MFRGRLLSEGFRSEPPTRARNQNAKRIDMRCKSVLVMTCLTMAGSCIFGDRDHRESAEHTDLIGRWEIIAINRGGQDINLDHLEGAIREIRESTYSIIPATDSSITGNYTINDDANPKTIDQMVNNGRFQGKTLKGIYRIHDHQLTISFGGPGEARPVSFKSVAGTTYTVAIHKKTQ